MSDARRMLQNHYQDASRLDARLQLHVKYSTNTQGLHSWVFERLRLPPTCQVLEVGCGSGQLWLVNQHRLPAGWNVTLSDLSPGMLATAHHQLRPYGHALRFVVHDAQALPFAAHSFDAIIANHMLYHVPNRPAAYAEFCRVLKSSGRLYATTISRDNMRELDALVSYIHPFRAQERAAANPISDRRQHTGFNLEHGAEELSQWFATVTLHRYADALVVPEAEPLVAYVRSIGVLTEDELGRFRHYVADVIARHGPIHISKDVGMFEACQANASV
jgi:ubiquinone/menaquinone biosynthesis C-methylase UbiE